MVIIIKLLIYVAVIAISILLTREVLHLRRRSPPKLSKQLSVMLDLTKPWYEDKRLEKSMSEAGLGFLSAWTYKLCRDIIALLVIIVLHIQFLLSGKYPLVAMIFIVMLYGLSLTGRSWMPFSLLLDLMQRERIRKKNDDIVMLYMLFVNATYTETDNHFQSVLAKLKEFRKDMQALRSDLDELILDFQIEGAAAFKRFGERVNTKESKTLALILEKMNGSNPQTAADLLEQHYDTFLDYRRQRRKRQLRANGHIGFSIVFIAIIAVVFFINAISGSYQELLYQNIQ